ncbi:MAG: bifunctional hydroxymethylpyrimidine kinase/phosphomethylpyrimidine kinase [Bryobacteraceae bacterium]
MFRPPPPPVALTIAGSDPSGGAGLQADLKTFHQFGVYGTSVVTLVTAQNTTRVDRVECLSPNLVRDQLRAVLDDLPPAAAKTGALGSREVIETVVDLLAGTSFPLVVDPVMISKHGASLLAGSGPLRLLFPRATLVTPNLHEAAALAGIEIHDLAGMREAAQRLAALGARAVLVKGGHLAGDAIDGLLAGGVWEEFPAPRIPTRHTHGTGCTYSAAITAGLAHGQPLRDAVERAKRFISEAIRTNPGLGSGSGPVNHHAALSGDALSGAALSGDDG